MRLNNNIEEVKLELQVAPLIDVVFLLLIYFMVTASLIRKEADISFLLPAEVTDPVTVDIPIEVLIEVGADGTILVEGITFDRNDETLDRLILQIRGLDAIAKSQNAPFFVNILPHQDALHSRIINVMDACAAAGIESLTFSEAM